MLGSTNTIIDIADNADDASKKNYLFQILHASFPDITDLQVDQLYTFYQMIIEKNKVMNLTAITDYKEFVTKHFLDSLMLNTVYSVSSPIDVIDIGTGAGFPGIPLKILYPQMRVTLFDSLQKRLTFLDEVISELHLTDIVTVHGRAEEFGRKEDYREKYDLVVSRAVAELTSLCEISIPFVKVGGSFVSYKGSKGEEELNKAKFCIGALGCKVSNTSGFSLYEDDADTIRYMINIKKNSSTNMKYPRGGGKPFSKPLYLEKR